MNTNREKPALVVMAAGMGTRYGGLKQVDPVGPGGEAILDYSVFDAVRAGFGKVVFVIRRDIEEVFREKVGAKYEGVVPVEYAFQELGDLPEPYRAPEGRTKPWGTAHAIYAARKALAGAAFAAINADDFLGRDAFARIGEFLGGPRGGEGMEVAMVGYELGKTLSENGAVARGVCKVSADGMLESITEMTKIVRAGDGAENREEGAEPVALTGKEATSMNLWGFPEGTCGKLEGLFAEWLEENAGREKSEWYIALMVEALKAKEGAKVRVLPTSSQWFGVTYPGDRPQVVEKIAGLVEAGEYPAKLFG